MDFSDVDGEEGFSFMWTIQNCNDGFPKISLCKQESPTFTLNDKEKWFLAVIPNRYSHQGNILLMLERFSSDRRIELTLELAIRTGRGMFKKVLNKNILFDLSEHFCLFEHLTMNKESMDPYFNDDSLTIKCRIWKVDDEVVTSAQCYARTIMGVERITYTWDLEGFGDFESEARITKQLLLSEIPSFAIDFLTARDKYDKNKIIKIEIKQIGQFNVCFFNCKMSLVDADGKIAHTVPNEVIFKFPETVWTFPFIQVSKILSNKKLYLPNGILSLRCEFAVPTGVAYNKVERTEYGLRNNQQLLCCNQTAESNSAGSLKDNLQRFFAEGKLSDLTIRASNKEFPVHKTILCARSEVFMAMFERDMKEARTGVVEIDDVDDDTVSKLLLFLYTDTVEEDLEFGTASSLYFAADKYGIVALKRKCSNFLKGNFTVSNVCDALVLADMHQDPDLKSAAQKFILEHCGEIMKSEEWNKLMQKQLQLASQTMHLYFQNL